jgi:hypothetical protein
MYPMELRCLIVFHCKLKWNLTLILEISGSRLVSGIASAGPTGVVISVTQAKNKVGGDLAVSSDFPFL